METDTEVVSLTFSPKTPPCSTPELSSLVLSIPASLLLWCWPGTNSHWRYLGCMFVKLYPTVQQQWRTNHGWLTDWLTLADRAAWWKFTSLWLAAPGVALLAACLTQVRPLQTTVSPVMVLSCPVLFTPVRVRMDSEGFRGGDEWDERSWGVGPSAQVPMLLHIHSKTTSSNTDKSAILTWLCDKRAERWNTHTHKLLETIRDEFNDCVSEWSRTDSKVRERWKMWLVLTVLKVVSAPAARTAHCPPAATRSPWSDLTHFLVNTSNSSGSGEAGDALKDMKVSPEATPGGSLTNTGQWGKVQPPGPTINKPPHWSDALSLAGERELVTADVSAGGRSVKCTWGAFTNRRAFNSGPC